MDEPVSKRAWSWGRWPWITTVVAVLLAISPPGQAFIEGAFSGEALSRNIARPILIGAALVLVALGALEAWIGWIVRRRRARRVI